MMKEGIVLVSDIKTEKGLLLIPRGGAIQRFHISKEKKFQKTDSVVNRISIVQDINHKQKVRG